MKCIVVTPDRTVLDMETDFVSLPLYDGEIGIAPKHAPVIGRLGYGELRIKTDQPDPLVYYIQSGFVEVLNDIVTVLTENAIEASKIDFQESKKRLEDALAKPAKNEELMKLKQQDIAAARAQHHIALKRAGR